MPDAGLDGLLPAVYGELRRMAILQMQQEREGHTLQPTALVHEVYLRLREQHRVDWANRAQFLAIAARMMRRVLLDYYDQHHAAKRGSGAGHIPITDEMGITRRPAVDFFDLDQALIRLTEEDAQQGRVVELRFFGGLTIEETAEVMGISRATVEREWATARLWLARQLDGRP